MNLKQMEYFVAAAEQLNFTRAAKKCFISQTAMTLQIQSLEERIGVPLFVRDKHHVELTAAGKGISERGAGDSGPRRGGGEARADGSGRRSWGADDRIYPGI